MGMSASQARYLGLTARKNNNEFEAQQITEQRTMLAMQTDAVAANYTKKMSNKELLFVQMDATSNTSKEQKLTYDIITSTNPFSGLSMRIVDATGKVIVPIDQTARFDQMQLTATDNYIKALNNRCFTDTTTNADNSTTETILNGQNYINSYLSGTTSNPVLDKDGNAINIDAFKEKVKYMDAPTFHDFWNDNKYSSADLNVTKPSIKDRSYTEDDASAKTAYDTEIEKINDLRNIPYKPDSNCTDADYLEKKLRSGEWFLEKHDTSVNNGNEEWTKTSWQGESAITDAPDKSDDAEAEAEYTQKATFFQRQDKALELRMKQLDTEHGAIQTEMDSVKKVIDKNIEGSFKTFA